MRVENFFGIMKSEMFYGHEAEFKTLDDLRKAMEEYIIYYNTKRITEKNKRIDTCRLQMPIFRKASYLIFIVSNFLGTA